MLDEAASSTETQRKWLKFLLERVGQNNLSKLLDYYVGLGWITGQAAQQMRGMAGYEKQYKGDSWTLSAEEQRISRLFIEKIKGRDIDDSLLFVPFPGKAKPGIEKKIEIRQPERIHPAEKKKMEISIHRREVTISNLEAELAEKDAELLELREKIHELETVLEESRKELMRNKIYMDIMDENIMLKKVVRRKKKPGEIKD